MADDIDIAEMRKFFNKIAEYIDLPQEQKDFLFKKVFDNIEDPLCIALTAFLKDHLPELEMFYTVAHMADNVLVSKLFASPMPVMFLGEKLDEIRVYPNMMLGSFNLAELKRINVLLITTVMKQVIKQYKDDIKDPVKKQAWEPLDRALKRLFTYEDMPTSRAIARFLIKNDSGTGVRDLAAAIDETRKPMDIKFTESATDFMTMYSNGPSSCMTGTSGDASRWKMLSDAGIMPTSFFHYHPATRGAYAVKGGKVIARAILYTMKGKEYYGRPYGSPEIVEKFCLALKERNITAIISNWVPDNGHIEFSIPGIKYGSQWACPYPYFDNMACNYYVNFNNETKVFSFTTDKTKGLSINTRPGHLLSNDYISIHCTLCSKLIQRGVKVISTDDGHGNFCSENHAYEYGYFKVIQGNSNVHWETAEQLLENERVKVKGNEYMYFTTLRAAVDNGYAPVMEEIGIFPEETDLKVMARSSNVKNKLGQLFTYFDPSGIGIPVFNNVIPIKSNINRVATVLYDSDTHELVRQVD